MKSYEEQSEEVKEYIKRKTTEEVIKRYLAVLSIENEENNERYKMKKSNYIKLYNALDPKLRAECEAIIKEDIAEGRLDLRTYLEGLKIDGEER